MKVLFDSSALFKRYAGEAGAEQVLDLHGRATSVVEVTRTLPAMASAPKLPK